jgi:hypothetical protein
MFSPEMHNGTSAVEGTRLGEVEDSEIQHCTGCKGPLGFAIIISEGYNHF